MSDFYKYFQENMDALGLPAPESLFGTATAAVANAAAILGQVDKMGKSVTVGELVGAGTILEGAGYLAGCLAAADVGAVIGSLAVATGRSLSGGTSLADVLFTAKRYKLDRKMAGSRAASPSGNLRQKAGVQHTIPPAHEDIRMRDTALLLLASALCCAFAWAFWHYLGKDAFSAMSILVIVILGADNARLRKHLRTGRGNPKLP